MATLNRMATARNEFQGKAKRVLCVCSAGLLRSPTAAVVLNRTYGFNTRAVGYSEDFALVPIDLVHVYWADEILCVSMSVSDGLDHLFGKEPIYIKSNITVLEVHDKYEYMDPELQKEILRQYAEATEEELSKS
jgi:predicted protein tyrosine phosphatase